MNAHQTCQACGKLLGPKNQSGFCRACVCRRLNSDPAIKARRVEAIHRKLATDPAALEACRERCARARAANDGKGRFTSETAREASLKGNAARPKGGDVRARAAKRQSMTLLAHIPADRQADYRQLTQQKRLTAAEATAIVMHHDEVALRRLRKRMLAAPSEERAIFAEYLAGKSYSQIEAEHGISAHSLSLLLKRVGGKQGGWAPIAAAARERDCNERVAEIARVAGMVFGLKPGRIWADTRKREVVGARQAAFLVARRTGIAFPAIGRAFEMDHSTVIFGCRKAEDMIARDQAYAAAVARITELCAARPESVAA